MAHALEQPISHTMANVGMGQGEGKPGAAGLQGGQTRYLGSVMLRAASPAEAEFYSRERARIEAIRSRAENTDASRAALKREKEQLALRDELRKASTLADYESLQKKALSLDLQHEAQTALKKIELLRAQLKAST